MLCAICRNAFRAPRVIVGPETPDGHRVYYDHQPSFLDLRRSAQLMCHLCTLIHKVLQLEGKAQEGLDLNGDRSVRLPIRYWIEHWIPERHFFLVHFRLGDCCSAALRLLSPSRTLKFQREYSLLNETKPVHRSRTDASVL